MEVPDVYYVYTDACPGGGFVTWSVIKGNVETRHERSAEARSQNEAEAKAILIAINDLPSSIIVQLYSDSQLIIRGLTGKYDIKAPHLDYLIREIQRVVQAKNLFIQFNWIPRERNLAGQNAKRLKRKWKNGSGYDRGEENFPGREETRTI